MTGRVAPPPELTSAGPATISVVERVGGGVHGPQGLRLAGAHGPEGARLHRRFDGLSVSATAAAPGPLRWRVGSGDTAAEIAGAWRPAGDGRFLLSTTSPGETLDGFLRELPGRPGWWELDLVYTSAGAARVTLARVTTACAETAPPEGGEAGEPRGGEAAGSIVAPAAYDVTIRPVIDGTSYPELPGTLAFLQLLGRRGPPWPPFLLIGNSEPRPGLLTWGATEVNDADVTVDGRSLHVRLGPEHADGTLPSWFMPDPGGLPLCLPYAAATGTADFTVEGDSVTGTVRLDGPPGGHSFYAEVTSTGHRDAVPAAAPEPEGAWLDLLCAEFDLTLHCVAGIAASPAVPAVLRAFPADLEARVFEFSLTAAGVLGEPGYINWSLSGLSTEEHVSGNRLTITGPQAPEWYADDSTLVAVADARLELDHDLASHAVAGELIVTGVTGRVFRAVIDGRWRGAEAAELRRRLAAPELNGSWRGVLGTSSVLTVTEADGGWWWPPASTQNGCRFLRHATGPDLAAGIAADGAFVVLERAEPADAGEAAVTDGSALRTVGQRLLRENRYAEGLRLLDRAAARLAEQADLAERAGHEISAGAYLISASASVAERAFCALALGDYPGLLRCLSDGIACRRRLIGLSPGCSPTCSPAPASCPARLRTGGSGWTRTRTGSTASRPARRFTGCSRCSCSTMAPSRTRWWRRNSGAPARSRTCWQARAESRAKAAPPGSAARFSGRSWPGSGSRWSSTS